MRMLCECRSLIFLGHGFQTSHLALGDVQVGHLHSLANAGVHSELGFTLGPPFLKRSANKVPFLGPAVPCVTEGRFWVPSH